jgi:hypothetical protein
MFRLPILVGLLAFLAACGDRSDVTITRSQPVIQTASRSEPVFYNGKTYHLEFSYVESTQSFDIGIAGMTVGQQADAIAVASSGLGHFACPDGQQGRILGQPVYGAGKWALKGRCA